MAKQLIFIFLFLFFISSAYALNVSGGESITFDVGEDFEYYDIVGNSTDLQYVEISQQGTNITIDVGLLASPDSFSLIFFNEKEVVKEVNVGGGGTRTRYVDRNVTQYVDREVEKIVEVEDEKEINRLLGIANDAVRREHKIKMLFILVSTILLIIIIIKLRKEYCKGESK